MLAMISAGVSPSQVTLWPEQALELSLDMGKELEG